MSTLFDAIQKKLDAAKASYESVEALKRREELLRAGFSNIMNIAEECLDLIDDAHEYDAESVQSMREELSDIFESSGYTYAEFEAEIGLGKSTIWEFLKGRETCKQATLDKIRKYLMSRK